MELSGFGSVEITEKLNSLMLTGNILTLHGTYIESKEAHTYTHTLKLLK